MITQRNKTILIDLDGVLNEYEGKFDENAIPKIKSGAEEFLKNLSEKYRVKIFTTRNKVLASKWIIENGLESFIEDITSVKEVCWLFIDDRCINFNGSYFDLKRQIENFKPWYGV